ncbi:protein DBF4 homolog A isoform X2 [Engraulis encrasicolus]|uniref:protein DBF4 homolog A isoform X2 n=1 Tax=Engraulis encrasicolus TaxID=184585 RepID=UPI002FD6EBD7
MNRLTGKVFYLDLPPNKRNSKLENDIKTLGGTVEKFFSKDIRYLVSSKPEARYVHRLAQESPVPSPESGVSSPRPGSSKDRPRGSSSHGHPDTAQVSRGKALVEKVVKEQERFQMNKMFSDALEWGVKILYAEDLMAYIEKRRPIISAQKKATTVAAKKAVKVTPGGRTSSQKHNGVRRISKPFVKVEDASRRFKPLYLHMANMPACNFSSAPPASPFYQEERKPNTHMPEKPGGKGKQRRLEGREKRKNGFCECCAVNYDKLQAHVKGERHQSFVAAGHHYQRLDALIATLPWAFAQDPPPHRDKLSVSTLLTCAPVTSHRAEEAGGNGKEIRMKKRVRRQESQTPPGADVVAAASCSSSHRKRGRGSPSRPTHRDSTGEAAATPADAPETSVSNLASYVWGSCPSLWRVMSGSPPLRSDAAPQAFLTAPTEVTDCSTTQHTQRDMGRAFQRVYGNKRRTPSGSGTNSPVSPGFLLRSPGAEAFDRLLQHQDSPVARTTATQNKSARTTLRRQTSVQKNTVVHRDTELHIAEEKSADLTKQESAFDRLFNTVHDHSTLDRQNSYEDHRLPGKPVDSHTTPRQQQATHYVKRVSSTPPGPSSSKEDPAAHTTQTLPCRTVSPPSSSSSKRFPKRIKRRSSGHFITDQDPPRPGQTLVQHVTDSPNPETRDDNNDNEDVHSESGECSRASLRRVLRRRVRPDRSWKRGRCDVSLGPPTSTPHGQAAAAEEEEEEEGMTLMGLFRDDDDEEYVDDKQILLKLFQDDQDSDMQEDFLGFDL